ncbi:hypothetical protein ATI53_101619 [Salipiger aestuarii]|uniref:Uncharacterized protein n=1 Tax=Salipiger aestuarii TaxID=568098 RepID=A0A327Y9A7_9RHOB|nr:hypothetical protein [Salipiger aestuarii]RAK17081.1 hypothetical protein ATI53_101619 [Salipiger aestuarii]
MPDAINGPFIQAGASGQLGSRVIDELLARAAEPIAAITPHSGRACRAAGKGDRHRAGGFHDPATSGTAFDGHARRRRLAAARDPATGKRRAARGNAMSAATKVGVPHILYPSLTNPDENNPIGIAADHRGTMMSPEDTVPQIVELGRADGGDGIPSRIADFSEAC